MRKILSIDGGGIKGVFPAAFLAEIEEDLEHPIGHYFDLIAGTSTGGILALGLGVGLKAREILALYEDDGPDIFDQDRSGYVRRLRGWINQAKHLGRPKYSPAVLKDKLVEVLGDTRLGDSKNRLLIPAWHPETRRVHILKTAHHERFTTDYKELAVDVALATSAAPSYFPAHVTSNGVALIDGGIWANNPTSLAVVEAIGVLCWSAQDIRVLSIGCLEDITTIPKAAGKWGLATHLTTFFVEGQSKGATGMARILLGDGPHRNAVHRIQQSVLPDEYKMDDTGKIDSLKNRATVEAREQKPVLTPEFFSDVAEEFDPVYEV